MRDGPRYSVPTFSIYNAPKKIKSVLCNTGVQDGKNSVPVTFFMTRFHRNILNQHLKHAKELKLPATLTLEQWVDIVNTFDSKCAYCQKNPYGVVEHFVPLSFGGGTTAYNCIPACQSCNVLKSGVHPSQRVKKYLEAIEMEESEE